MALELAWLDHGEELLEARFDHVRDAVLGKPYSGFLALGAKLDPQDVSVSLTYDLVLDGDDWRMWVVAECFGIVLATDSRMAEPPIPPDGGALVLTFTPDNWKVA